MLITFDFDRPIVSKRYHKNYSALTALAKDALALVEAGSSPPPPLIADSATPDKPLDVQVQGARLYGDDARRLSRRQVETFVAENLAHAPPQTFYTPEDEIAYQRIQSLDSDFGEALMARPRVYAVPRRYAPILVVFGIGLGWHIETLLEQYDTLEVIICETEPALFHASLYATDWTKIVRHFSNGERRLTLVIDRDTNRATHGVLAALDRPSRALAVGARFFMHYHSQHLKQVAESVARVAPFLSFSWGYFKDERRQVLQAEKNIRAGYRWLKANADSVGDVPVVIVGSGPSLERTLPIVRSIREKVILFSVGSSLRALLRASLVPDFHVELETAPSVVDVLHEVADEHIFEHVTLFAAHGISPDVAQSFRHTILFVRENSLSSTMLGSDTEKVPGSHPLAGNAAVGLAARLGFTRVILFGVDFGYRDPKRHHAVGTIYVDEKTGLARDLTEVGLGHLNDVNLNYADTRHVLTSISGDQLLAENVLWTSHVMMEKLLRELPELQLTQCGDGARIAGASNVLPEDFGIADFHADTRTALVRIQSSFATAPIDSDEYRRRLVRLAAAYDTLALDLRKLFERPVSRVFPYARLIDAAWHRIVATRTEMPALAELVTGIFTSYFKATVERSLMTKSDSEQRRFIALAQSHFVALLDDVSAALESFRSPPDTMV